MPRRVKNVDVKYNKVENLETPREINKTDCELPQIPPDLKGLQGIPGIPGFGNMDQIINMAQKIAKDITSENGNKPLDPKNLDMSKIFTQVTENVSKIASTPEFMNQMNPELQNSVDNKVNQKKSKINLNPVEETLQQRTKDLHFTLNVTLEELYTGKTKKLAVRRKRIIQTGDNKEIVEEKKKLTVVIEPGMHDDQVITFNNEADEKEGYETGDIIITLSCSENEIFTRDGNNLIIEKEISLYEIFKPEFNLNLINGKSINIKSTPINIFGDELESYRKLVGYGMPILNTSDFGDLIILFKPVFPSSINDEGLEQLKKIFPPVNVINGEIDKYEQLEIVTESDFELSDDSDDSEDESEDESEDDSDDDSEDDSEDELEEENED